VLTNVFVSAELVARGKAIHQKLAPYLDEVEEQGSSRHLAKVEQWARSVRNREIQLNRILYAMPDTPLFTKQSEMIMTNWVEKLDTGDARVNRTVETNGRPMIQISASEPSTTSWRSEVLLPRGAYVLEAEVQARGLKTYKEDSRSGVALRISGETADQTLKANGRHVLRYKFHVMEDKKSVSLVCEMRSCIGEIGFYLDNLKLTRSNILF
jgi:hypothetical protein